MGSGLLGGSLSGIRQLFDAHRVKAGVVLTVLGSALRFRNQCFQRKLNRKGGTLAFFAFDFNRAAMGLDNLFGDIRVPGRVR